MHIITDPDMQIIVSGSIVWRKEWKAPDLCRPRLHGSSKMSRPVRVKPLQYLQFFHFSSLLNHFSFIAKQRRRCYSIMTRSYLLLLTLALCAATIAHGKNIYIYMISLSICYLFPMLASFHSLMHVCMLLICMSITHFAVVLMGALVTPFLTRLLTLSLPFPQQDVSWKALRWPSATTLPPLFSGHLPLVVSVSQERALTSPMQEPSPLWRMWTRTQEK